ncbi:MAG TPA: PEGA domain-containing protein [Kofleriaceae bacterium]|nr:PEGA domain-containing protein [Kofleriaceae bacterium]
MVRPVATLLVPLMLLSNVPLLYAQAAPADDTPDAKADDGGDDPPSAPAPVKDPKQAKQWSKAAEAATKRGDVFTRQKKSNEAKAQYDDALMAWQRSIEFGDEPAPWLAAAGVAVKLGKFDVAVTHLQALLARADVGNLRGPAQTMLDEASMQVGLLALVVAPDDTLIALAGKNIGKSPLKTPLVLMPGDYVLEFAADGYQPKQLAINVEAGSESERKVELEAIPINIAPEVKPQIVVQPPKVAVPKASKTWLYAGGAATIALGGAATAFGFLARSKYQTYTDTTIDPTVRESARVSGRRFALLSDVSIGAGALALASTCYYYFAVYRPKLRATEPSATASITPKVLLGPWVEPGVATGVSIQGGF